MDNKRTNISQIQKYLNGELDASAMHRLELEAQADPFLMDALDGYGGKADQESSLVDLKQRLQQRATKTERRIIPMWYWQVAASVLILAGAGAFWYSRQTIKTGTLMADANQKNKEQTISPSAVSALPKDSTVAVPPVNTIVYDAQKPKPTLRQSPAAIGETNVSSIVPAGQRIAANKEPGIDILKDSTDLSDVVMNNLVTQKKPTQELAEVKVAIDTAKKYQVTLNGRAQGVQTNPNLNAPKQPIIIEGVVIAKDNGLPIPGVNVRVLGSTTGTLTDANGKFALSGVKDKTLSIASLGYESAQVNLKGKDSLKIALSPNTSSLAEVVVSSGNQQKINQSAHPNRGWKDFKKYLKESATPVNGVEGTVKLQFTVEPNGRISNIKVTKGLNAASDANAINLINNGPGWYGNTNDKPEVVKVKVEYKKR